jgi:hypothetical protein
MPNATLSIARKEKSSGRNPSDETEISVTEQAGLQEMQMQVYRIRV